MKKTYGIIILAAMCIGNYAYSQSSEADVLKEYLLNEEEIKAQSLGNLVVTNAYDSRHLGVRHVYASQSINDIRIYNSQISSAISTDGNVAHIAHRLLNLGALQMGPATPGLSLEDAIEIQLQNYIPRVDVVVVNLPNGKLRAAISGREYSHETTAELVYFKHEGNNLKLAWLFDLDLATHGHWNLYLVDAQTGEVLQQNDLQISCQLHPEASAGSCTHLHAQSVESFEDFTTADGSQYNAFRFPIESPNHGTRSLISEPADATASPFGWHDTDGEEGAEFTITRGNNVHAYDDVNNANSPGFSPDGGDELIFDYPYDPNTPPSNYLSAAVTNLFYANNWIHDILWEYGFDEAAGNFQVTNYSGQGEDGDDVRAEAQDGGGLNNANMATPPDGSRPRMQMYLWDAGSSNPAGIVVNTPEGLAGSYPTGFEASWGAEIPEEGITGNLAVLVDGDGVDDNDGCEPATNGADLAGNIVLVRRGNCTFVQKTLEAQNNGAIACLIVNDESGLQDLGGNSSQINIPSLMITQELGEALITELSEGGSANVTLNASGEGLFIDGSFDNGIIVHEYIHGLTNRLTGGPARSGCLFNEEQMGEGWSDWYAIMTTMDLTISNPVYRPMGTFAIDEPTNGIGIRPAPYDTSFAVNDFTYADVSNPNLSVPHGVGFVWSTMLWDMTWALIDEYGYDENLIGGNGGNNLALQLVTDALKLQPCWPGFVEGRDAILAADQLLTGGANQCLIWGVFARRGLGALADGGSPWSRSDGTADFSLPTICQEAVVEPVANFAVDIEETCTGLVSFTDLSEDVPQSWLWDFGDGNTSEEQNPSHQYETTGTYTVSLTVTNSFGEDVSVSADLITVEALEPPVIEDVEACVGDVVMLTGVTEMGSIEWSDENGLPLSYSNQIEQLVNEGITELTARTTLPGTELGFIGPEDNTIAGGGNHASDFTGGIYFEAERSFIIRSAFVVSGEAGPRTIQLYDGLSWDGQSGFFGVIDEVTVNIDFEGPGVIPINLRVPGPGFYAIGLNQADLYRNNGGVEYPFVLEDVMTITGSTATTADGFYYYFYNLEIVAENCFSDPVPVTITGIEDAEFEAAVQDLTVTFTDLSNGASSWSWDFGDGNSSDQQNPVHTYQSMGTYDVNLTIDGACSSTQEVQVGTVSVNEYANSGYAVMPNPARDFIRIEKEGLSDAYEMSLFDISGKLVMQVNLNGATGHNIYISGMSAGSYILSLRNREGEVIHREQIILQK
jgi:PKD repeat protein